MLPQKQPAKKILGVGDILVADGDYDKTNLDFYEITEIKSSEMVVIRKISSKTRVQGLNHGFSIPIKGCYISEPLIKQVSLSGTVPINTFKVALLWDGKEKLNYWYS